MGVTLSSQGSRELERAASSTRQNSPAWQPAAPNYGQTENSWSVPSNRRSTSSWTDSTPSADLNRSWNYSTTTNGQYGYHNSSDGVSGTSNRVGKYTYHNFSNG